MHNHYIVLVGQLKPLRRAAFTAFMNEATCSWFNYTTDAWIVCTSKPEAELVSGLKNRFPETHHAVIKLESQSTVGGLLPEDAWKWLRRHDLARTR